MPRLVPIILTLDGSQPRSEVAALKREFRDLNRLTLKQAAGKGQFFGTDTRQIQDFIRLSKESARVTETNARSQARLAEETSRRVTNSKKSELKQFEDAERSKQRIAETNLRNQARLAEEASRQITNTKKSELRQFENAEKSKQRVAEVSARSQAKAQELALREEMASKRREYQEFVRLEREKTRVAREQARSRSLQNVGSTMQSAGGGIKTAGLVTTAAVTAPIVAGFLYAIKIGVEYEQSMNMMQAVTSMTAEEMKRADALAIKLGNDLTLPGISAKDAAEAMTELGKNGMTAAQAMDAVRGTLLLSTAAGISAAEAAEITANSLNMFNLSATESSRVADLLAGAANASSAEILDIAASLQQAGAVFANAKVPIEDVVTLIGLMANQGIKGSDAGTSLKTMMQRLQSPTDNAAAALKGLNIQIYDQKGAMLPMRDIISQFENSLKGLTQQQKDQTLNTIFGADAVRAASIVFSEGTAGYDKMAEAVKRANAAQELAAARTKGLGGAWEAFKSQLETGALIVFNRIKPMLNELVLSIGEGVQKLTDAFVNLSPGAQQAVLVIVGLVAALGPLLIIVGAVVMAAGSLATAIGALGGLAAVATIITVVGAVIAALAVGIGIAVAAVDALSQAWELGFGPVASFVVITVGAIVAAFVPILGLPIAIAGILATIYQIWTRDFGGIRTFTLQVWEAIKSAVDTAINAIADLTADVGGEIVAWWKENYPLIKEIVGDVSKSIQTVLRGFGVWVSDFWTRHGETIKTIISGAWSVIRAFVMTSVKGILAVIKIFLQMINGDWAGAWQGMKNLAVKAMNSLVNSALAMGRALIAGFKALVAASFNIGADIINGIIQGIKSRASDALTEAGNVAYGILNVLRSVPIIHSPSAVTTFYGEMIAEGLAVGLENKSARVKSSAKKLADETLKELADAIKDFDKLSSFTPGQISRTVDADRFKQATTDLREIIKLRAQLGVNQDLPLPKTPYDAASELKDLQARTKAIEDGTKALEDFEKAVEGGIEAVRAEQKIFGDLKTSIEQSGAKRILDLREEISLVGVTDDIERQRIQNYFDILRLREDMQNDGYGAAQIDEAARLLEIDHARALELQRILQIRKEVNAGESLGTDLEKQLLQLRSGKTELSEYDKTLLKINTDLKNLSSSQKEYLLNLAQQVDAQKAFNEQYKQTYDFIRNSLDILTDSGTSFGEKMKSIFGGIFQSFRKMVLDMTAQWLTSKLFGGGSGGGFSLGNIFSQIFGGGNRARATPNFNPSSGGGFNLGSIGRLFGFGGGGSSSSGGGGSSSIQQLLGIARQNTGIGGNAHEAAHTLGGSGGIGLAGGLNIAGLGLNLLGSAIGGRSGGILSSIGSGVSLGATIGSVIPGIGTAIGAAVGAVGGLVAGLLGGDPKRKADAKENMPKLRQGFAEALAQLKQLAADKNAILNDPKGAVAKALELQGQIASGFGIDFQSKKYRGIAKQQIAQKLEESKKIVAEIQAFADTARDANRTAGRLKPEFAGGIFMDEGFMKQFGAFKRRNGMLAGAFTGRDTLPSMLAPGEMVLNPMQIERIKAAGFDAFKYGDIPNYAAGTYVAPQISAPSPSFTAPNFANSPVAGSGNVNVKVELHNVDVREDSYMVLTTEKGKRKIVEIYKEAKKNKEIS